MDGEEEDVCVCVWRTAVGFLWAFSYMTYDLSFYINTHYVELVQRHALTRPATYLRRFFIAVSCWTKYPPITFIHL